MNTLIDINEADRYLHKDPSIFFSHLNRQLEMYTGVYASSDVIAEDNQYGEQLTHWADDIKSRLFELGFEPESPAYVGNFFGAQGPLEKFRGELGLSADAAGELDLENRLEELLTFESDSPPLAGSSVLARGDKGIQVRVLQYRLKKLGFFHAAVNGIFQEHTAQAVVQFKYAYGIAIDAAAPEYVSQELWQMTGDPASLARKLENRMAGRPMLVPDPLLSDFVPEAAKASERFFSGNHFTASPGLEGRTIKELFACRDVVVNHAGVALLQLLLWMGQYYTEAINGRFDNLTLHAFLLFIEENHIDLDCYMAKLADGRLVVAPGILEVFDTKLPNKEERYRYERFLDEQADEIFKRQDRALEKKQQEGTETNLLQCAWYKAKSVAVNLYHGIKRVVVIAAKAIARGARWIWRTLGRIVDGSALHFMAQIMDRIKKGLATFWSSLKRFYAFLRYRAVSTVSDVTEYHTHFFTDFDVMNICQNEAEEMSQWVRKKHFQALHRDVRLFSMACDILGGAIHVVISLLSPPIGWVRAALKVVRVISDIVRQYHIPHELAAEGT